MKGKKITAILMAVLMVVTMLPVQALAKDDIALDDEEIAGAETISLTEDAVSAYPVDENTAAADYNSIALMSDGNDALTPDGDSDYTLILYYNVGTKQKSVVVGDDGYILPDISVERDGYINTGWRTSQVYVENGVNYAKGQKITKDDFSGSGNILTLFALWKTIDEDKYAVKFDPNSINYGCMDAVEVTKNSEYEIPACGFTRPNRVFDGWATAADGEAAYAPGDKLTITQNTTFYPVWRKVRVCFDRNGGSGSMDPVSYEKSTEYTIPDCDFKREGYFFAGWSIDKNGEAVYFPGEQIALAEDITLYALWSGEDVSFLDLIGRFDGGYLDFGGIRWRVIGQKADETEALLISADVLGGTMNWATAKQYCNDLFNSTAAFSSKEKSVIKSVFRNDRDYLNYWREDLNGGNLFLLSGYEADKYFINNEDRKPGNWWLRSPHIDDVIDVGVVDGSGVMDHSNVPVDNHYGARPAFVLNLSSVLFTSAAEGGKSSAAAGSGFGNFSDGGTEAKKLTLLDSSRSGFAANVRGSGSAAVASGGTVAINYSGAGTGTGEYVSAMLCNSAGDIIGYASVASDSDGADTWSLTLPSDLTEGATYTLKVFSEQQNGDNTTDYASAMIPITLTVGDAPAPEKVATPTFSPAGGTYTETQTVTISCATSGADIFYTTGENAPTSGSTKYSGAISVASTTSIKAIAIKNGMTDSEVATVTYTINSGKTDPVVTPPIKKNNLKYTGSLQELVTAGSVTGGTMYYAVTESGAAEPSLSAYTESVPKKKDAGSYDVWYKVTGDASHNSIDPDNITVTIAKADALTIDDITLNKACAETNVTASIVNSMPADAGALAFTAGSATITRVAGSKTAVSDFAVSSEGEVTAVISNGTAGDKITLPVTISSGNYNDSSVKVVITIHAKEDTTVTVQGGNTIEKTYGDDDFTIQASVPSEAGSGTWKWTCNDASVADVTDAGTVSIKGAGNAIITASFESETAIGEALINLTVNKKDVTVTGVSVSDKEYDGGTAAVITEPGTLNGAVEGDDVSVVAGTAAFADKNVGSKAVTFSGFTLSGTGAGNYNLASQPADTTAMITAKGLTVNVSAVNRAYERGNITVGLTGGTITGVVAGDDVSVDTSSMTGRMADAGAGTGKSVTVTGLALKGTDAANYTVAQPVGLTADISKAVWNDGTGAEITKTYLYTQAAADSVDLSGFLPADSGSVNFGIPVTTGNLGFKTAPSITGSVMTYELNSGDGNANGSVSVTALMQNYEDYGIKVNIRQDALALYEKVKNNYVVSTSRELAVDKSFTLVPMFVNGRVLNRRVVWESSNPDVATVTQDGKVTARSGGSTRITVRSEADPGLSSYCMVTVNEPVTAVNLNRKSYTFGVGESVTLNAKVLPFTAIQKLNWTKNNDNVNIAVSDDGMSVTVTAVKAGKVKVTASAKDGSNKKAECSFTIGNPVPDFTIAGKNNASTVTAGKTLNMTVNWGGKAKTPKNAGVKWSLAVSGGGDASAIASITSKGELTAITAGKVIVTATSTANPSKSASAEITVTAPVISKGAKVTGIKFNNTGSLATNGLVTGKGFAVKHTPTLSGKGKGASNAIAWFSSDTSVATVSQKGAIKAIAPGKVTITAVTRDAADLATAPSDSVTFDVYAKVKSVKTDKTKLKIGTQDGTQYGLISIASMVPDNARDMSVKWTAANKNVRLAAVPAGANPSTGSFVEAGTGVTIKDGEALAVMGVTPGTVKLTGITTDGSKKKVSCTVIVRGEVTGLTLKTSTGNKGVNDVTLSDNAVTTDTIEYTSVMKANSKMTLTPVVDINGVSGSATDKATKKTYAAYKKYTDTSVSYRSSDTSVATVDKKGKISVKKGTAGKTATIYVVSADGKQKAEILITVK